ncbi:hypothetical protein GW17_00009886 [Ensete ventricosum]|nr:hypothetical protein GW17_00009886 [Ensete ventricosum]
MNPAHSQVLFSTASPLQAFADLSIERELFKPASKAASLSRKRIREIEKDFVVMDPDQIRKYENMIDEDGLTRKFKDHFILNKDGALEVVAVAKTHLVPELLTPLTASDS